jgi:hypothetical protein
MADTLLWPQNATAQMVDCDPNWRLVPVEVWEAGDMFKFAQVPRPKLIELLRLLPSLPIPPEVSAKLSRLVAGESPFDIENQRNLFAFDKVDNLTQREAYIERLRSSIPLESLLQRALQIALTGQSHSGLPATVKEQLSAIAMCINKALPEAKSIDRDSKVRDLDRQERIRSRELTSKDLHELTEEELDDELTRLTNESKKREAVTRLSKA